MPSRVRKEIKAARAAARKRNGRSSIAPPQMPGKLKSVAKLAPKHAIFVAEYLVDLSAKRAASVAGVSAQNVMQREDVQQAIANLMAQKVARLEVSADTVVRELSRVGFANMLDYVEVQEDGSARLNLRRLTRDQAAAIVEVTTDSIGSGKEARITRCKIKLADKMPALLALGRHLQMAGFGPPAAVEAPPPPVEAASAASVPTLELARRVAYLLQQGVRVVDVEADVPADAPGDASAG